MVQNLHYNIPNMFVDCDDPVVYILLLKSSMILRTWLGVSLNASNLPHPPSKRAGGTQTSRLSCDEEEYKAEVNVELTTSVLIVYYNSRQQHQHEAGKRNNNPVWIGWFCSRLRGQFESRQCD